MNKNENLTDEKIRLLEKQRSILEQDIDRLEKRLIDIQVKGTPAKTLVIARWTATCQLLNGESYINKGVHFITLKWGKAVKFDVYEDTKTVSHGLDIQFESGIKEAKAPKIES